MSWAIKAGLGNSRDESMKVRQGLLRPTLPMKEDIGEAPHSDKGTVLHKSLGNPVLAPRSLWVPSPLISPENQSPCTLEIKGSLESRTRELCCVHVDQWFSVLLMPTL